MTSRLTLSAAARTWGKSRQTLYTDLKAGKLSVGRDEGGMVFVDAAEMVRAYGEPALRRDGPPDETGQVHAETPEPAAGTVLAAGAGAPIASVKVVEFAWVGEAAIGGQAALGGSRVGASSVGGISISAMASTCM